MLPFQSPTAVAIVVGVVLLAGAITGVAGFGFALIGTMVLATIVDPALAVVFMILPIFSVNLSLVSDLSRAELRDCGRRFAPLVVAAFVGTILGMVALDRIPSGPLKLGLGLVSLGFVASAQDLVPLPGRDRVEERCFVESGPGMVAVGGISGLLFGGTNVGVQLVAFLRSCDLSHRVFIGVVALVFLGLNGVRVFAAGALGLYSGLPVVLASLAAAVPAVAGVAVGRRFRDRVPDRLRTGVVHGLLLVIGVRLVLAGSGF